MEDLHFLECKLRTFRDLTAGVEAHNQLLNDRLAGYADTLMFLADRLHETNPVLLEAFERYLGLEERAARPTALMNAAVAYEIAGYQANAACLARLSVPPEAWSVEPTVEGLASALVQRLLLRVVIGAETLARNPDSLVVWKTRRIWG